MSRRGQADRALLAGVACRACNGGICTKHVRWLDGEAYCVACVPTERRREAVPVVR